MKRQSRTTINSLKERTITNEQGCWIWQGAVNNGGYAELTVFGKKQKVTRHIMYLLDHDINGFSVCHRCDVTSCINPEHLFLGTHKQNMLDASRKGRLGNFERNKTHCDAGHEFNKENTYYYSYNGKGRRICRPCNTIRRRKYVRALLQKL